MSGTTEHRLRDGGRAVIRPLRPEDRWRLVEGFRRLSPRSRLFRFGRELDELEGDLLDRLMDVDDTDHVALIAIDPDAPTGEPGLGIARFLREPYDTFAAEAAVTVAEDQRGRGVGTLLLGALAGAARDVGITEFRNYVLVENDAMLAVFRDLGARVTVEGARVLRLDLPLTDGRLATDSDAARVFRAVARLS